MSSKIPKLLDKQKLQKSLSKYKDVRVLTLIAFLIGVLLVSWNSVKVLQTNYGLYKQESELKESVEIQRLKNQNLELKNTYLQSDEYLELTARRQFSKGAEGEKLYFIPKDVALSKTKDLEVVESDVLQAGETKHSKYVSNLIAWREFIFKKNAQN